MRLLYQKYGNEDKGEIDEIKKGDIMDLLEMAIIWVLPYPIFKQERNVQKKEIGTKNLNRSRTRIQVSLN